MQEEYLSALLLRSMKPKPKRRPPKGEVAFEWGLLGANDDALQMYVVRASGVTRWTLDGEWDKDAEVSFVRDAEGNAPVVLHQQIPGLFALECEQITVERGPQKRYAPPPAPSDREFVVWGPTEVCLRELLDWVSPPTDVLVFELEADNRVIARPSGTEPKIKFYFDVREPVARLEELPAARARARALLARLEAALLARLGL